jgi:hypothetical protein
MKGGPARSGLWVRILSAAAGRSGREMRTIRDWRTSAGWVGGEEPSGEAGVRMDARGERFSTRDRFHHLLGGLRGREGCIRASFRSDGVAGEPLMWRRSGP